MDISKLAPAEAIEAVTAMETVEQLREAATSINVKFSGNTGEGTLRQKLMDVLTQEQTDGEPEKKETKEEVKDTQPVPDLVTAPDPDFGGEAFNAEEIQNPVPPKERVTKASLLEMDRNEITDPQLLRQVVRAQAMRLHRVRVTNLDPADAQLNGAIVTVVNKFTGKVSKYIPYGDEAPNGYHIPEILYDHLKAQKFALRKEVKGGSFGVKKYKTTMVSKYAIEDLPALTQQELQELAAHQRASHAIDN